MKDKLKRILWAIVDAFRPPPKVPTKEQLEERRKEQTNRILMSILRGD